MTRPILTWARRIAIPLAALLLAAVLWSLVSLAGQFKEGQTDAEIQAQELQQVKRENRDQSAATALLEKQLKALGQEPVVSSDEPQAGLLVNAPSLLRSALEDYCDARGQCRGPAGPIGAPSEVPGPAGKDSTVPGPEGKASTVPGPSGSDGKNGSDGKDGKDGEDGKDGAPGAPGRGIQTAQCGDDGRWTVTYTDGASEDAGLCRALAVPAPD